MNKDKFILIGLFLIFFVPLFIAMGVYFSPSIKPLATRSHGTLISPVQTLPPLHAHKRSGEKLAEDFLTHKWTLLYWGDSNCSLHCEAGLFKMRQVRLALGKRIKRLQMIYLMPQITTKTKFSQAFGDLLSRHKKLTVAGMDYPTGDFHQKMQSHPEHTIYLIDVRSNLMMSYTKDASAKGMLRDLKKLLTI